MKQLSFAGLLACGVALAMISTVNAQVPSQGSATVLRIKGSARYTTGNNVWEPLKTGAVLRPGTVIQVGLEKGSYVDLALNNSGERAALANARPQTFAPFQPSFPIVPFNQMTYRATAHQDVIRAYENTILGIDRLTAMNTGADVVTETQLDLRSGRILGNVKKMSAASRYEVKMPAGVAGIRGTVFQAIAPGLIQVASGSVVGAWVADGATRTQVVMGGEELDMTTGALRRVSAESLRSWQNLLTSFTTVSGQPIVYSGDRTIHYVSPTSGIPNSGGGDGGGDGEYGE